MFRTLNITSATLAAGIAAAVLTISAPSTAQTQQMPQMQQQMQQGQQAACDERGKILTKLGKDYAERRISLGLAANGNLLEVLASKSGSWTMIYTMPNGGSCLLATGQSWIDVEPTPALPASL